MIGSGCKRENGSSSFSSSSSDFASLRGRGRERGRAAAPCTAFNHTRRNHLSEKDTSASTLRIADVLPRLPVELVVAREFQEMLVPDIQAIRARLPVPRGDGAKLLGRIIVAFSEEYARRASAVLLKGAQILRENLAISSSRD